MYHVLLGNTLHNDVRLHQKCSHKMLVTMRMENRHPIGTSSFEKSEERSKLAGCVAMMDDDDKKLDALTKC